MAMLEPGDILIDCTGSKSLLRDQLVPGSGERGWRREHAQDPARIRARHHLPVRPDVRLQRVLQVLQEHRERALQVHSGGPPHVLRRQRQPRDGHRQHHRRGLRGDAVTIRRRVASQQLSRRRPVDGPLHRQDQAGNQRRDTSATWRSSGYRWICTGLATRPAGSGARRGPATTRSPARRCSWSAIRPSARRTFSRSRWASSARCSWRDSSRSVTCRSRDMLDRYELYIYKQWLRVYMRSKMIKHNKDLFESRR